MYIYKYRYVYGYSTKIWDFLALYTLFQSYFGCGLKNKNNLYYPIY